MEQKLRKLLVNVSVGFQYSNTAKQNRASGIEQLTNFAMLSCGQLGSSTLCFSLWVLHAREASLPGTHFSHGKTWKVPEGCLKTDDVF